jgi:hypothetical protein
VDALGILNICIGKYFFCNRTVLNEHFTLPGKFHFTGLVRWVCFYRTSPVEQEIVNEHLGIILFSTLIT